MTKKIPWLAVYGFGAHIKSTQDKLIILHKGRSEEYPLQEIRHLLIVGGHTLSSTTVSHLMKNGSYLSFFDPDGMPVGSIRPKGDGIDHEIYRLQEELPRQRYAIKIAQATLRSRLVAIGKFQTLCDSDLLYAGELDILHNALDELEYLVKMDEILRLSNLTSGMYYEILARIIPDRFNFKQRTVRPLGDPVNAMLSFGYSMLYGNCMVAVIGSHMDPDCGLLHDGQGALIRDLINPFKSEMIDPIVCQIARSSLTSKDYELTPSRCMLSDTLIKELIGTFKNSIDNNKIDNQVNNYLNALQKTEEFTVLY